MAIAIRKGGENGLAYRFFLHTGVRISNTGLRRFFDLGRVGGANSVYRISGTCVVHYFYSEETLSGTKENHGFADCADLAGEAAGAMMPG